MSCTRRTVFEDLTADISLNRLATAAYQLLMIGCNTRESIYLVTYLETTRRSRAKIMRIVEMENLRLDRLGWVIGYLWGASSSNGFSLMIKIDLAARYMVILRPKRLFHSIQLPIHDQFNLAKQSRRHYDHMPKVLIHTEQPKVAPSEWGSLGSS